MQSKPAHRLSSTYRNLGGQASHTWWPSLPPLVAKTLLYTNKPAKQPEKGQQQKTTQTAHKFHSTTHKFLITTLATQKHFHKTKITTPNSHNTTVSRIHTHKTNTTQSKPNTTQPNTTVANQHTNSAKNNKEKGINFFPSFLDLGFLVKILGVLGREKYRGEGVEENRTKKSKKKHLGRRRRRLRRPATASPPPPPLPPATFLVGEERRENREFEREGGEERERKEKNERKLSQHLYILPPNPTRFQAQTQAHARPNPPFLLFYFLYPP